MHNQACAGSNQTHSASLDARSCGLSVPQLCRYTTPSKGSNTTAAAAAAAAAVPHLDPLIVVAAVDHLEAGIIGGKCLGVVGRASRAAAAAAEAEAEA
jgi:hypothetical protein